MVLRSILTYPHLQGLWVYWRKAVAHPIKACAQASMGECYLEPRPAGWQCACLRSFTSVGWSGAGALALRVFG